MARAAKTRTYTLRRASSIVFALISILPLLLFVYTLYALDLFNRHVAQLSLGLALVSSMIGFYIYSVMMSQLSDILLDLQADESAPPPAGATHGSTQGPVVTMAVEPGPSGPTAEGHAAGAPRQNPVPASGWPSPFAARGRPGTSGRAGLIVPGMGRITELKPADESALSDLNSMWRTEAEPLLGKRVLVAVRNAPDPMKGILAQVTPDGVILDQNGARAGISYARLSAIEADTTPGAG